MLKVYSIGLGSILLGSMISVTYEGIFIDFDQKRFREYTSISGFKIGQWHSLPKIKTVKLISKSSFKTNTPNGISPTFTPKVNTFIILIYSSISRPFISLVYSKREQALIAANYITSISKAEFIETAPEKTLEMQ